MRNGTVIVIKDHKGTFILDKLLYNSGEKTLCKLDYRINEVIIKCFSHFNWIINGRDGNISGAVECGIYLYISMVQPNNSLRA